MDKANPVSKLFNQAKSRFDLTEEADRQSLADLTEAMLALPGALLSEVQQAAREESAPLEFRIAAKLAESRRAMLRIDQPLRVGVVFAMWGEQRRLLPKSDDNSNGEDSLRVKLEQLDWVCSGTPVDWTLYAVDDGCPHCSGKIAAEIAAEHVLGSRARILHLAEHLPAKEGALRALASAEDSRKGGAVLLGAQQALADAVDVLVYTDADNSVHLGQLGLLLEPYVSRGIKVVLGNRKHPDAVLVKQEGRWGIGIKVLRHMQRMLGCEIFSRGILDTQAAFKLYSREVLERILAKPTVFDFSFDTDWILAAIAEDEPFETVPFAFIDSFAESASITQGPMTTWETLLRGLLRALRERGVAHNEAMGRVLDEEIHSAADLEALIHHLPRELEEADPAQLGDPAVMSPEALQAWIGQRKLEALS
ncbi:MAG: glycosyltransferase [Planctomycetota bacterium]|nr:MAG: glycosyltransferase [Planctomycetota bacterium]